MNGLEFTASLIGSLAWPTALLAGLLLFRKQIRESLKELMGKESGQFEVGMLKAQWEAKAAAIEADIEEIDQGRELPDQPTAPRELRDLGMLAMGKQIMSIYNVLTEELQARGVEVSQFQSMEAVSAVAVAAGIIEPDDHKVLVELARLIEDLAKVPVSDRLSLTPRVLRLSGGMARRITESTERARGQRLNQAQ